MYSVLLLATPLTIYSAVDREWQCQCALVEIVAVFILEVSEKMIQLTF